MKNGMLLALIDEYRKSIIEFTAILSTLDHGLFDKIADNKTTDKDCKSIKSITLHIVQAGYTYANYINSLSKRKWLEYQDEIKIPADGIDEINKMLDYTENSFDGLWEKTNEALKKYKFETKWNVTYDLEQILEHAIVHVLRHRRQVENLLKTMTDKV